MSTQEKQDEVSSAKKDSGSEVKKAPDLRLLSLRQKLYNIIAILVSTLVCLSLFVTYIIYK